MRGLGSFGGTGILCPAPQQPVDVGGGLDPAALINQPRRKPSAIELAQFGLEEEEAKIMREEADEDEKRRGNNAFRPFNDEITPLLGFAVGFIIADPFSAAMSIQQPH